VYITSGIWSAPQNTTLQYICGETMIAHTKWDIMRAVKSNTSVQVGFAIRCVKKMNFWFSNILGKIVNVIGCGMICRYLKYH